MWQERSGRKGKLTRNVAKAFLSALEAVWAPCWGSQVPWIENGILRQEFSKRAARKSFWSQTVNMVWSLWHPSLTPIFPALRRSDRPVSFDFPALSHLCPSFCPMQGERSLLVSFEGQNHVGINKNLLLFGTECSYLMIVIYLTQRMQISTSTCHVFMTTPTLMTACLLLDTIKILCSSTSFP